MVQAVSRIGCSRWPLKKTEYQLTTSQPLFKIYISFFACTCRSSLAFCDLFFIFLYKVCACVCLCVSTPGIRQLQLMLLKVSLILGVEIHVNVEFVKLLEPLAGQTDESESVCGIICMLKGHDRH